METATSLLRGQEEVYIELCNGLEAYAADIGGNFIHSFATIPASIIWAGCLIVYGKASTGANASCNLACLLLATPPAI